MKKTITLLLALFSATLLLAKPYTQQGIAYLYDYKTKTKKPVANVSLTVAYAKGPAISRTDGTFTIEFQDFGAGKKLAFEKQPFSQGLIVLNKKEVDGWSTFEGRLTLIMCNKQDFDACKQNYYNVGLQSVTQRYEKKIAALKKESADYQQRLQELEEERDRIMDNLRNSADAMARIDQSELDAAMQEVLDLYEQGNVDEAMQKLEDMKLEEKFVQTLERKQQHEAEDAQDSIQILNKLRTSVDMYQNNGNWNKAAETLKLLADKVGTLQEICAYSEFCMKQHNTTEGLKYGQKAWSLAQDSAKNTYFEAYITIIAEMMSAISECAYSSHFSKEQLTELYSYIDVLTDEIRHIAKRNPKVGYPILADHLTNMAVLKWLTNIHVEQMHKEALEIFQRLAKDSPKTYEPKLAGTLYNIADYYSDCQRFSEAEDMYKQALEIRQRLAKDNPKAYEPDVAKTLNNLANLYSNTQRLTEAEELYKHALEIRQRLAEGNPKAYKPDLAQTLHNLANLYSNTQRLTEAEELYKHALEIRQRLAKDNPMEFNQVLAESQSSLAFLYIKELRFTEAEVLLREALDIYQQLSKNALFMCEPQKANVLYNIALIYRNTQRFTEAENVLNQALEIYQQMVKGKAKIYELNVNVIYFEKAILYSLSERFSQAEPLFKKYIDYCSKTGKDSYQKDVLLAEALTAYAAAMTSHTKRFSEAKTILEQALEIYQRINKEYSKEYEGNIAMAFANLALLYSDTKQYTKAEDCYKKALTMYQSLAKGNPQLYFSLISSTLGNMAYNAIFMKKYSEAEQLAREGLAIDSTQHFIYSNLAAALLLQGRYNEAEPIYRQYKDELKEGFLDDFEQFKAAGVIPQEREEDVEKIKQMLEK